MTVDQFGLWFFFFFFQESLHRLLEGHYVNSKKVCKHHEHEHKQTHTEAFMYALLTPKYKQWEHTHSASIWVNCNDGINTQNKWVGNE